MDIKEVVKLLFDHSDRKTANLNAKGIHARTAFMKACNNGHFDIDLDFLGEFSNTLCLCMCMCSYE